jgi:hypothetical protein
MPISVPTDADRDSEMMPIRIPGRCRSLFRTDADHTLPSARNGDRLPRNPVEYLIGEVTLD